jgi:putative transposase
MSHPPPYTPTWRGLAERRFGIVPRGFQKSLGGVVEKDTRTRTDRYFPWDGRHTLAGLMLMLLRAIHTYHCTPISGRQPPPEGMVNKKLANTPLNRWNWGVVNHSGRLRDGSRDAVRQALWPTATANLSEKGIRWEGAFYKSPNIEEEFWRTAPKKKGSGKREKSVSVDIRYDPSLMDQISFISYGYQEICELHPSLNDHDLHGVSLAEWRELRKAGDQNDDDSLREGQADRIMQAHNTRVDDAIARVVQKGAGAAITGLSTKKATHPDARDMRARRRVARKHEAKFSKRLPGRPSPSASATPPGSHSPTHTVAPTSSGHEVPHSVNDAARSLLG